MFIILEFRQIDEKINKDTEAQGRFHVKQGRFTPLDVLSIVKNNNKKDFSL